MTIKELNVDGQTKPPVVPDITLGGLFTGGRTQERVLRRSNPSEVLFLPFNPARLGRLFRRGR
jgi:hypothetical protein